MEDDDSGSGSDAGPRSLDEQLLDVMAEYQAAMRLVDDSLASKARLARLASKLWACQSALEEGIDTSLEDGLAYMSTAIDKTLGVMRQYAALADDCRMLMQYSEPSEEGHFDTCFNAAISQFSQSFLATHEQWKIDGNIDALDDIRMAFIEAVTCVGGVYSGAAAQKNKARMDRELAELHPGRSRTPLKLDDIPPVPDMDFLDPSYSHPDVEDKKSSFTRDVWEYYLSRLGCDESAFSSIASIPGQAKAVFLLYHYSHLVYALQGLHIGDFERAAERVEALVDYEQDGTGLCFVATALDSLAAAHSSVKGNAGAAWDRVVSEVFKEGDLDLESVCSDTSRRDVAVMSANKVKQGSVIIRRYSLDDPVQKAAAEKDLVLSRFVEQALDGQDLVPFELNALESEGILYHVEKRIPGKTFDRYIMRDSMVAFNLVGRVTAGIVRFHSGLATHLSRIAGDDHIYGHLERQDPEQEFQDKFIARLGMLAERSGLAFETGALTQAMAELIGYMEPEAECIIHNDMRGANIIITPGERIGLIDFEKLGWGKLIFDIVNFVEHSKIEGNRFSIPPNSYDFIYDGDWFTEGSPEYFQRLVPAAAAFKISHLCGTVIKYHLHPIKWQERGRARVLSYLREAVSYCKALSEVSDSVLSSAARELQQGFGVIESKVDGCVVGVPDS